MHRLEGSAPGRCSPVGAPAPGANSLAGSMNECSCCTADELVLVPSGGAPGRVASTARRHMHADNAGVKRLNYTRESIPAAGGQQFDLVAVGVFDEGEDAGAVHHGTGFAHDLAAGGLDLFAGLVDIIHFDGDVTVAGTQVVAGGVPVVGQLQHGVLGFVTVADEGQG